MSIGFEGLSNCKIGLSSEWEFSFLINVMQNQLRYQNTSPIGGKPWQAHTESPLAVFLAHSFCRRCSVSTPAERARGLSRPSRPRKGTAERRIVTAAMSAVMK